jgi:hypothetical protein
LVEEPKCKEVKRRPSVSVAVERSLEVSLPMLSEGDCWSLNGQDHAAVGAASKNDAAATMHKALLKVIEVTFMFQLEAEGSGPTCVRFFCLYK